MSFVEARAIESDEASGGRVLVTYRVRVCRRCGHEACPYCATWCDVCLSVDDDSPEVRVHPRCAKDWECEYDEPDDQAVVELRREPATDEVLALLREDP